MQLVYPYPFYHPCYPYNLFYPNHLSYPCSQNNITIDVGDNASIDDIRNKLEDALKGAAEMLPDDVKEQVAEIGGVWGY